jgi:uncharacterized protein (DUF1778 family)
MASSSSSLMVRLDDESKSYIAKAAELRHVSISDYVRMVTVSQAQREVREAQQSTIALTSDEQLEFWKALSQTPKLTKSQQGLGAVMRGEQ